MAGTPKRFGFEIDICGARVVVTREPICSCCLTDGEVDHQIKRMKDELDQVAKKMKIAIKELNRKPLSLEVEDA
jgi:hypothetical protein